MKFKRMALLKLQAYCTGGERIRRPRKPANQAMTRVTDELKGPTSSSRSFILLLSDSSKFLTELLNSAPSNLEGLEESSPLLSSSESRSPSLGSALRREATPQQGEHDGCIFKNIPLHPFRKNALTQHSRCLPSPGLQVRPILIQCLLSD